MNSSWQISEGEAQRPEINLAPFVDTIMILLIFFVVTANLYVMTGVEVNKPKAQSSASVGDRALLVGLTREGTVHVYGRQVGMDALQALVGREVAKNADLSVVIVADQDAAVGRAVQIMDNCMQAGASKVSVASNKE
jgi:biopolymer transport protein ExbD